MLNYENLIQFNLLENAEKELLDPKNSNDIFDFLGIIQEIESIDHFIKDLPSYPGSTEKIIRNEMISAIGATLAIEGTSISKDEIEESFQKASRNEKLERREQEAENSRKVYYFIRELTEKKSEDFIYTESMIKQIHKYFTADLNYLSNVPGQYRGDFKVEFGYPRRSGLCMTKSQIEKAMTNFTEWLNAEGSGILSRNDIVKAIMAHYYLTEIHPFGDGNGRTSRATEALVLYINGINYYCFWSLANFWSLNKDEYIAYLGEIYTTSNPLKFLMWGLTGYRDEIKRIKNLALLKLKKLMLMDYAKYLLADKSNQPIKINQRIIDVLKILINKNKSEYRKFSNSPEISALYNNVSISTKNRDFEKMILSDLILIKVNEENDKIYIEPNFSILDQVTYRA